MSGDNGEEGWAVAGGFGGADAVGEVAQGTVAGDAILKFIEGSSDRRTAARRERQIKGWPRAKKERLWLAASG